MINIVVQKVRKDFPTFTWFDWRFRKNYREAVGSPALQLIPIEISENKNNIKTRILIKNRKIWEKLGNKGTSRVYIVFKVTQKMIKMTDDESYYLQG